MSTNVGRNTKMLGTFLSFYGTRKMMFLYLRYSSENNHCDFDSLEHAGLRSRLL